MALKEMKGEAYQKVMLASGAITKVADDGGMTPLALLGWCLVAFVFLAALGAMITATMWM